MERRLSRVHQEARGGAGGLAQPLAAGDDEAPGDTGRLYTGPPQRFRSGYPRKTLSTLE